MTDKERMVEAMKTMKEICGDVRKRCIGRECPFFEYCGESYCPSSWEVE